MVNREGQPPDTCWDALNVFPFDVWGRRRCATRFGLSKQYSTNIGSSQVQGLLPVNTMIYAGNVTVTSTTPISTFVNVPVGVSTSSNSISFPANFLGTLSDTGPKWTGVVPSTGVVLSFDVTVSGADAFAQGVTWWAAFNSTAHTFQNIFTSTRLCFSDSPQYASGTNIVSESNTGGGEKFLFAGNPPPPANGVSFHVDLTWDGSGNVSANIPGVVNQDIPPDMPVVSFGSASTLQFYGQTGSNGDTLLTLSNINLKQSVSTPQLQANYSSILVAVCAGRVWIGQPGSTGTITQATQSTTFLNTVKTVSMANVNFTAPGSTDTNAVGQGVYIVDGVTSVPTVLNLATSTVQKLVPKSSTNPAPTSTSLACAWRGRLVLAGDPNNPQNFYMSRAGDPSDWDYSQTDSAAAVAGNLSRAGQIGEPITALIPYTDDYMLIGCAHSLWMLEGDPADGGTIVQVSNQMGIVGKDAWCVDPTGTLYFIASGGMYSVRPIWQAYRPPELLTSQSWNQFFLTQDWNNTIVSMQYDADHHYLHMFFTPTSAFPGIHLTYDIRNGGLWPQQFHGPQGPFATTLYISDNSAAGRFVLIGGWDGLIRRMDPAATDDDGNNIQAHVFLGPFNPFPGEAAILSACTIDLGELAAGASSTLSSTSTSAFQVVAKLASGPDAFTVTEGAAHVSTAVPFTIDRRQKTMRQRVRGGWFSLNLDNGVDNAYFSFESATLDFASGGKNRERKP